MHLLLVRHGETVDNVAGVYAGITDSPLTNHGMHQAKKLGQFLRLTDTRIERIFSSDLQRAFLTAEAIREEQQVTPAPVTRLAVLREKNFGKYEGTKISKGDLTSSSKTNTFTPSQNKPDPSQELETNRSMRARAESFIELHLVPSLHESPANTTIVVVSHGIFLNYLWRELLGQFLPQAIHISSNVEPPIDASAIRNIKAWYNTGYLELYVTKNVNEVSQNSNQKSEIDHANHCQTAIEADQSAHNLSQKSCRRNINMQLSSKQILSDMKITISSVNRRDHLEGVRKSRFGTGSLEYVPKQRTMYSYFAKH